ncbi:hypothetical protein Pfo_016352 [Paulownia fortunei]|nr:hypothetical protein Pfo_016352 [Paulownia fortunei]
MLGYLHCLQVAIVDKGGLDALMEPELGPRLGNLYLSEEPSSGNTKLKTFMVVAEKDISTVVSQISSFMDEYSVESHGNQARELYEALQREQRVRSEYSNGSDILYSLEDLNLGAKVNLIELEPGHRVKLILGEPGVSRFFYNGILLNAQRDSGPFSYQFRVLIVQKIILDSSHSNAAIEDIQKDLSPLVKQLAPGDCDDGVQILFMIVGDGIKQREIVHQVTSALTGPIVVDDVIYEKIDDKRLLSSKDLIFRRLTFQRTESLVQSEALLSTEGPNGISSEAEKKKAQASSKTRKKGKQRKFDSRSSGSHVHQPISEALNSKYFKGLVDFRFILQGGLV